MQDLGLRHTSAPAHPAMVTSAPRDAHTVAFSGARLTSLLTADAYVRERLQPRLRDRGYLCLKDLRSVVQGFADCVTGAVLDYGCGGSPYEPLFTRSTRYVGADISPGPRVRVVLRLDGSTGEPNESYDAVLSSQVLEHVPDPDAYLGECFRVLKPGGQILLTTHGLFEEHACPHDYHRWTVRGIERLFVRGGFEVLSSHKLTSQTRGAIQLLNYLTETLRLPRRGPAHVALAAVRKAHQHCAQPALNWLGDRFAGQGVVPGDDPAAIYVGISIRARKPPCVASPM